MSKLEKKVLKLLDEEPRSKKEDEQKYLKRLLKAAEGMDEDEFNENFPDDTDELEWVNKNIKLDEKGKKLVGFGEPEEEEEEEDEKPKKKNGKKSKDEEEEEDSEEEDSEEEEDEDEDDKKSSKKSKGKKSKDEDEEEDSEEAEEDSDSEEDDDNNEDEDDEDMADKKKAAKGKDKGKTKDKSEDKPEKKAKKESNGNGETRSESRNAVYGALLKNPNTSAADIAEDLDMAPASIAPAVKYWHQITAFLDKKGKLNGVKLKKNGDD